MPRLKLLRTSSASNPMTLDQFITQKSISATSAGKLLFLRKNKISFFDAFKLVGSLPILPDTAMSGSVYQTDFKYFDVSLTLRSSGGSKRSCLFLFGNVKNTKSFDMYKYNKINYNIFDYIVKNKLCWLPRYFI